MPHFFKGHPTFHVSYLKKWKPMDKQFPLRLDSGEPPPLFYKDGQPYYSVEKILSKQKRRGSKEYDVTGAVPGLGPVLLLEIKLNSESVCYPFTCNKQQSTIYQCTCETQHGTSRPWETKRQSQVGQSQNTL